MPHPTQIFLHNPQALRVEFRLDDQRLELWWSPKAGRSFDARDRNFSNRDNHLDVFESITLRGFGLDGFEGCDYDPYHTVLRWKQACLHLAVLPDAPVLLLWSSTPFTADFKTARYDAALLENARSFAVRHEEPSGAFEFAAALGDGSGAFRHCAFHAPWNSYYTQAAAAPGQVLSIGVSQAGEGAPDAVQAAAARGAEGTLAAIESVLAPVEAMGRITAPAHPDMEALRRIVVRGLHSMIDESGAFRASIKAIYYLIWVRDSGFSFPYHEAAGFPHKLEELCRLLLANPTTARGPGIPPGRMFAQLINADYGKYEEDGIYYVLWILFTHWTQTGDPRFLQGGHLALVEEAMAWVERYIFDESRGLFGSYFADETPAHGARDFGWDYAIGQPAGPYGITHQGKKVVRSYDTYINTLMHSAYAMLAAVAPRERAASYAAKADALWKHYQPIFRQFTQGLPPYGLLLLEDGSTAVAPHWGPASSTYIWALTMPNSIPFEGWDELRGRLLDAIMEKPAMHWLNGICSAVSAADPWFHDEARLVEILLAVKDETFKPGPFLPMGGAMPEKFDAPQGNLYHDIRPQGFAMGAWLGAWSSLGLRRLPHGLALRPTRAYTRIEQFPWRGKTLEFHFPPVEHPALQIDGRRVPGTLQIPHHRLTRSTHHIGLEEAGPGGGLLWLRSTVDLLRAEPEAYHFQAFGLSEILFSGALAPFALQDAAGASIPHTLHQIPRTGHLPCTLLRFTHWGAAVLARGV